MKKYKINKYTLDNEQSTVIYNNSKHLMVIAGAGSGKTLTIVGKIKYLIDQQSILPSEIICISFTRKASQELKTRIQELTNYNVSVYTFHSLAMQILGPSNYEIADENLLDGIIDEFFEIDIISNKKLLKGICVYLDVTSKKEYKRYNSNRNSKIEKLKRTISTFIKLFKACGFQIDDFKSIISKSQSILNIFNYKEEKFILTLALNIYLKYQKYLEINHEIDFDDMLIDARNKIQESGLQFKVKYIIIDEFQDTSKVRFELIQSILDITHASLMVVGDDFQSIYRFNGCDLNNFLEFQKEYDDAKILKIQTTYRNSQELTDIAGTFIMKNRKQLRKELKSNKHLQNPIHLLPYKNSQTALEETILHIYYNHGNDILILGRNNNDIYEFIDKNKFIIRGDIVTYRSIPNIKIKYLTVHKSKGLEAENVIIINLIDADNGFPNKYIEEKILRYVSSKIDYPYSEERRLFYVALTRTKNNVYLLYPQRKPSIFISEITALLKK